MNGIRFISHGAALGAILCLMTACIPARDAASEAPATAPEALAAATAPSPTGKPGVEAYAKAITSDGSLAAYWRMEGDLADHLQAAPGTLRGGKATFVAGPAGGKALALAQGQFVTVGKAPHLDLPASTVELLFRLDAPPPKEYNPCLIAKRATSPETRFSVHVRRDLRQIAVWNGHEVFWADVPTPPLTVGQWHHLAVVDGDAGVTLYLDGVKFSRWPTGGFTDQATGLPLQLGASQPDGREQCRCTLDEVALFGRPLSQEEIAAHVAALGWADRREALLRKVRAAAEAERARAEARARRHQEIVASLLADPALVAPGKTHLYKDEHLTAISLPLGGMGGGCVQINGCADLHIWQIFNNFEPIDVPNSFFAVRAKAAGGKPVVRAAQTSAEGPFAPLKSLTFRGEFPFGWFDFEDATLPVRVTLEAWSPLVPLDTKASAMPCAVFAFTVENPGDAPVEVALLGAQRNVAGYGEFGGNRNEILAEEGRTVLHLSGGPKTGPTAGDVALTVHGADATGTAAWPSLDALHADFADDGRLTGPAKAGPSPKGKTLDGALAAAVSLAPGEKKTVTFTLSWHFPHGTSGGGRTGWVHRGRMYATWWPDALSVARDLDARLPHLAAKTRAYHDAFYETNLPHWLRDRINSQVAILKSPTVFWTADGYFGGWEGCSLTRGCCPGNCAHVWHYAQAHARLFPEIGRRMREQALGAMNEAGGIPFRQPAGMVACDGQCGEILGAYREHLTSADGDWLHKHWPAIRKAMEYVIATWDKDEDGVLHGMQHNTLDAELSGSSTWLGSLYLAALAASEKMARLEGQADLANRYRAIRLSGSEKQNATLWNGEYYIQVPDQPPGQLKGENYLTGCQIDQVLGQWWAHQLDLGWLYPPERVRTALDSLFRYNFRTDFVGVKTYTAGSPARGQPRKFVHDDDHGLLITTWPKGGRPPLGKALRFADEVMTGFEYSAAAAMVTSGLTEKGFAVVRAVADRYDGRLRTGLHERACWGYSGNPFGDDECGKFYSRAMSVWSLLLACQGFVYDGPAGRIGFRPCWKPHDHRSFFTGAEGWGVFTQQRTAEAQTERLDLRYGTLRLTELVFEMPEGARAADVTVTTGGAKVATDQRIDGRDVCIALRKPLTLKAGETLEVTVTLAK